MDCGKLHEVVFHSTTVLRPVDEQRSATALLAALIARGVEEGGLRPVDPYAAAGLLFAALRAAADAVAAGGDRARWCGTPRELVARRPAP